MKSDQPLHAIGERRLIQLHHEMDMIRHHHPVKNAPRKPFDDVLQQSQQVLLRLRLPEDRIALHTPRDDMDRDTERLYALASTHTSILASAGAPATCRSARRCTTAAPASYETPHQAPRLTRWAHEHRGGSALLWCQAPKQSWFTPDSVGGLLWCLAPKQR